MASPGDKAGDVAADIVFCGGCNPQIDRAAVAKMVIEPAGSGAAVLLSGCGRACASEHQLVVGPGAVVVAGEMVDGVPTAEEAIPGAIAAAIARQPSAPNGGGRSQQAAEKE